MIEQFHEWYLVSPHSWYKYKKDSKSFIHVYKINNSEDEFCFISFSTDLSNLAKAFLYGKYNSTPDVEKCKSEVDKFLSELENLVVFV